MFEVKKYGEGIFTDKTKIYFCAHPDDLCFFEEISDDILDAIDCSVFYDAYDEKDLVEREFDLLQMQLFVVPVTEKLLSTPSKAVDFDLKLARAKHIPVLPIMCDKGLSALFSNKFGSFQYLDRNSEDETEIDYKSKLRAFLSDLVVSEEGFMSVLSVFRAMIFLSYRKKDRLKAQELIKRIHEIDEMYDVGIWYDEFLKAGEDFNEQIDMFLQGSDLFVLAVTPSLLEKDNYVERVEYPQAREYDKKILPVVLTPTDSATLSERYEGIVAPVDISAPLFNEKIKEYIGESPIIDEEDILEHKYSVALAYLNGIGVEIDREVAVRILYECAEDGYDNAMDALSKMYLWGKGVECNADEGLKWRKRLIDKNRNLTADFPDKQTAYLVTSKFVQEAQEFLRYRFSLKKTEGASELISEIEEQITAVKERFPLKKGVDDFRLQSLLDTSVNSFYMLAGTQAISEKRYADAEKYFLEMEKIAPALTECQFRLSGYNGPIPEERLNHLTNIVVYPLLADLYNRMERYIEAEEKLRPAITELEKMLSLTMGGAPSERDAIINKYCFVRGMLALALTNLERYDEAEKTYLAVEVDIKRLVSSAPTVHTPTLATIYCSLAEMEIKRGDNEKAKEYIEKAERTLASFGGNKDLITSVKEGIIKIKEKLN